MKVGINDNGVKVMFEGIDKNFNLDADEIKFLIDYYVKSKSSENIKDFISENMPQETKGINIKPIPNAFRYSNTADDLVELKLKDLIKYKMREYFVENGDTEIEEMENDGESENG